MPVFTYGVCIVKHHLQAIIVNRCDSQVVHDVRCKVICKGILVRLCFICHSQNLIGKTVTERPFLKEGCRVFNLRIILAIVVKLHTLKRFQQLNLCLRVTKTAFAVSYIIRERLTLCFIGWFLDHDAVFSQVINDSAVLRVCVISADCVDTLIAKVFHKLCWHWIQVFALGISLVVLDVLF